MEGGQPPAAIAAHLACGFRVASVSEESPVATSLLIPAFHEIPLLRRCVRDVFINSPVPPWIPSRASSSKARLRCRCPLPALMAAASGMLSGAWCSHDGSCRWCRSPGALWGEGGSPRTDPRPVVLALNLGRGFFPPPRVTGGIGGTERPELPHRRRGWGGHTGRAGGGQKPTDGFPTPTQTLPVETSTAASPSPGSRPSDATSAAGRAPPCPGVGQGSGAGWRMLRLQAGSPPAPGALAAREVPGICRVRADGQIRGLSAPPADGQGDKSVCLLRALLLPKRPRGCKISADVIFHFPDLLKLRADY